MAFSAKLNSAVASIINRKWSVEVVVRRRSRMARKILATSKIWKYLTQRISLTLMTALKEVQGGISDVMWAKGWLIARYWFCKRDHWPLFLHRWRGKAWVSGTACDSGDKWRGYVLSGDGLRLAFWGQAEAVLCARSGVILGGALKNEQPCSSPNAKNRGLYYIFWHQRPLCMCWSSVVGHKRHK